MASPKATVKSLKEEIRRFNAKGCIRGYSKLRKNALMDLVARFKEPEMVTVRRVKKTTAGKSKPKKKTRFSPAIEVREYELGEGEKRGTKKVKPAVAVAAPATATAAKSKQLSLSDLREAAKIAFYSYLVEGGKTVSQTDIDDFDAFSEDISNASKDQLLDWFDEVGIDLEAYAGYLSRPTPAPTPAPTKRAVLTPVVAPPTQPKKRTVLTPVAPSAKPGNIAAASAESSTGQSRYEATLEDIEARAKELQRTTDLMGPNIRRSYEHLKTLDVKSLVSMAEEDGIDVMASKDDILNALTLKEGKKLLKKVLKKKSWPKLNKGELLSTLQAAFERDIYERDPAGQDRNLNREERQELAAVFKMLNESSKAQLEDIARLNNINIYVNPATLFDKTSMKTIRGAAKELGIQLLKYRPKEDIIDDIIEVTFGEIVGGVE